MRNPNGYGSVYKLSGNRRRPWVARITEGFNEKGHPIYKILGYYAKRPEAVYALAEYNREPWNMNDDTVDDIIEKAIDRLQPTGRTKINRLCVYNKRIAPYIGKLPVNKLRLAVVQNCVDKNDKSLHMIRSILKCIERYALEFEYISKPFADFLVMKSSEIKHDKKILSHDDIVKIHNCNDDSSKMLLLFLYTGMRKEELLKLKKEQITKTDRYLYITAGSKTKAGKNRIIPVHPRIRSIVEEFMQNESIYLLPESLRKLFGFSAQLITLIGRVTRHRYCIHEFRHTFRTELDRVKADIVCTDRIMGHSSSGNVGMSVYTHKTIDDLYEAISLITYNFD